MTSQLEPREGALPGVPTKEDFVELSVADFLALIEEAKDLAYEEAVTRVRAELEEEMRRKPVYQGVLGFLSWVFGKMPDSNGKPSGSWTLYVLAHTPIIMYMGAVVYGVVKGINYSKLTVISPWIPLFPLLLAWTAWLAHHKKVAEVVVMIVDSIGRAFSGVRGGSIMTATTTLATAVGKVSDASLTPGKKIELKKKKVSRETEKTDPNSLPVTPE